MNKFTFPVLEVSEIVVMLQKCDFSLATEENILRPSSEYVITLYKQIIESYMGMSAEYLLNIGTNNGRNNGSRNNTMEGLGESNEYDDNGAYIETLQILVLNKICYKFFQNIGVDDFNIMDLYKPDAQRMKRLLSAIVNYARFRGERIEDCTYVIERAEQLLSELLSKFDRLNLLQQMMKQYQDNNQTDQILLQNNGDELTELHEENIKLETQLKKLTQVQEALSIDYNNYKDEKQKMLKDLESLGFQWIELDSQKKKLEKYSKTDMDELTRSIDGLSNLLKIKQSQMKKLEVNQKNLQVSVQTFQKVIEDLYDVIRLLSTELQETHRNEVDILDFKQQLSMRRDKMQEVLSSGIMYKLSLLEEQLHSQQERLNELKKNTKTQAGSNDVRIAQLKKQYSEDLIPKIREQEEHIERDLILGVIKGLEAQISDIQSNFQKEVDAIELEYSLLASHINQYMERMLERMN